MLAKEKEKKKRINIVNPNFEINYVIFLFLFLIRRDWWLMDHRECALRVTVSPLAAKAKNFSPPPIIII